MSSAAAKTRNGWSSEDPSWAVEFQGLQAERTLPRIVEHLIARERDGDGRISR